MNNGYRGMLRDRIPATVSIALKWCKAKERWIEYVYSHWVGIVLREPEWKKQVIRDMLGLSKYHRGFNFEYTIQWNENTEEENVYWNSVKSWVLWFQAYYVYIENTYKLRISRGVSEEKIKLEITNKFLNNIDESIKDRLLDYLIKTLKEE